jgi:dipeptidyl aminopeptidase/acylaminoacyl peptidase
MLVAMKQVGGAVLALVVVALMIDGCHEPRPGPEGSRRAEVPAAPAERPGAPRPEPATDYALARRSFHTKLLRTAPSPQPFEPTAPSSDARQIEFDSGGHKLPAWISAIKPAVPTPAVLFLHGGFAFGSDDWAMAQPFRDAGFVMMVPILRGENGSPGAFTLFYDEVDDVLAAAAALAEQPGVDPRRIYVSGHSAGGVLAMFAAMTSARFRAAAPLSAAPDAKVFADLPELVPFDVSNEEEFRMRSPLLFAASFQCPARLFVGDQENLFIASTRETARRAKATGRDVEAIIVPGNHFSMTQAAIPLAVTFFQQQR